MTSDQRLLETSFSFVSCVTIILHCNDLLSNFMETMAVDLGLSFSRLLNKFGLVFVTHIIHKNS